MHEEKNFTAWEPDIICSELTKSDIEIYSDIMDALLRVAALALVVLVIVWQL